MSFLPSQDYTVPYLSIRECTESVTLRLHFTTACQLEPKRVSYYSSLKSSATASAHHLQLPINRRVLMNTFSEGAVEEAA